MADHDPNLVHIGNAPRAEQRRVSDERRERSAIRQRNRGLILLRSADEDAEEDQDHQQAQPRAQRSQRTRHRMHVGEIPGEENPTAEELRIARMLVRQRTSGSGGTNGAAVVDKERWRLQVDHNLDPAVRETISTNRTILAGIGVLAALLIGGAFGWIIRDRVDRGAIRARAERRRERRARQISATP